MNKFVSVIIPVLNNIEGLRLTLTALDSQTYACKLYEVIIVDNGSSQDIAAVVNEFQQALLTFEKHPGSYIARNQGISIAKGEIIAFTDSDCIPQPDWIANGVAKLLSVNNCGLVAGKINFFYHNPQQPTIVELYDSLTFLNQKKYVEQYSYGATANMFTWKRVIRKVGDFKPQLMSGGDKEWGKRVANFGYRLVYSPDACITHPARSSWREIFKKVGRTRTGGHNLDTLNATNSLKLSWQKLAKIIWLLKPPTRTIFNKLNSRIDSVSFKQKNQLIGMAVALHYYGVWLDFKFYLKSKY